MASTQHRSLTKRVSFHSQLTDGGHSPTEKCIAVFTSGGDSQGMNAALRGVVRIAIYKGLKAFLVYEGYKGLVEGGDHIKECQWGSVSYILHRGGTVIGTARCKEFREQEGRLKAAENLIKKGINNLVIIGGDGSLTGANIFKNEWTELLGKLLEQGRITSEQAENFPYLNIVGLVGSIDNDMCGTDMTIGTDSALHRIVEAMDCLSSTASSHQRSFVMEVMGRHCGYLTLMAGIAGGADWILIPENPPRHGWEDAMCTKLEQCRDLGRRLNFVLVAEGAVDINNKKITPQYVKEVIESKLGYDTRITVLGHVQRGGKPSAYDRVLGSRMGTAAALVLARAEGEIDPVMIALQGNEIVEAPLMECVNKTRSIDKALKECQFDQVRELRGRSFLNNIKILKKLEACSGPECKDDTFSDTPNYTIAVMNVGAPACGTNSCTRSFVRLLLYHNHTVLGIHEGFVGCVKGNIDKMTWSGVSEWGSLGGSNLGTNRDRPTDDTLPEIAAKFEEHGIQGLLVIGGFEAFESLLILEGARSKYPAFRIPILQVAATISNNVPGTEYSLGCDTALNVIVSACDVLKQSATASRKRVFVVQTMGGYCGYLATMGGLAGGADSAYIFEEPFSLSDLQHDLDFLVGKFREGYLERGIIIRNENCNENITTEFMTQMLSEEGKDFFISRSNVLGHLQQGDRPSPFDRILGSKYASHAMSHLLSQIGAYADSEGGLRVSTPDTVCVLGLIGIQYVATPVSTLKESSDMVHRIPKEQWWMQLRPLVRVLSRHVELSFSGETHREKSQDALDTLHTEKNTSLFQDKHQWVPPLIMIGLIMGMTLLASFNKI